ncbi:B-cell receptor CD22 [Silurus meridionalis]|nr:B-cell receptor CD22 [Silurus meridionalis]
MKVEEHDSPKNVYISFSTIPSEGISVTLTCSSDANPPVESYTWFKENEASPVGSGQSYRALLNVPYYCKAQNNLGSERSATVFITITIVGSDVSINVYVAVGLGLFALAVLLSALFWLRCRRQKNNPDEGDYQNVGPSAKDDTYAALDPADRKSDDVYQTLAKQEMDERKDLVKFDNGMKVSRSKTEYMCVNEREGSGGVRLHREEVEKVKEFRTSIQWMHERQLARMAYRDVFSEHALDNWHRFSLTFSTCHWLKPVPRCLKTTTIIPVPKHSAAECLNDYSGQYQKAASPPEVMGLSAGQ